MDTNPNLNCRSAHTSRHTPPSFGFAS